MRNAGTKKTIIADRARNQRIEARKRTETGGGDQGREQRTAARIFDAARRTPTPGEQRRNGSKMTSTENHAPPPKPATRPSRGGGAGKEMPLGLQQYRDE
jgi:hypothetical protein